MQDDVVARLDAGSSEYSVGTVTRRGGNVRDVIRQGGGIVERGREDTQERELLIRRVPLAVRPINGMRVQRAVAAARVTDADGNAGAPEKPGHVRVVHVQVDSRVVAHRTDLA
jgi:hypothetical protein